MSLLSFCGAKDVAWWNDGGRRCVSTSCRPPSLLLSFLLAVIPSLLCSLVKDSSLHKFNQTAWIKAITQFVYKASFILCQANAPFTMCDSLTPDLCWGHMMHLLCCSTRVYQTIIRRQGAKEAWWESHYSNLCNTVTDAKPHDLISRQGGSCKWCLINYSV